MYSIKKIIKQILPRKQSESTVAGQNKMDLTEGLFLMLTKIGFNAKHIVDVGANHGSWTRMALKYFPNSNYSLFEPQSWLKKSIEDILEKNKKIAFHALGVADKKGSFPFTIASRDDSSTFRLSKAEALENGLEQIFVPLVTLDEFLNVEKFGRPDIIKIDAEGLDLKVLEGCKTFFGKTEIFIVEASVVCKELENTFIAVINTMDKYGYKLFDIIDMNRTYTGNLLWLSELVFVKKAGFIDSMDFSYADELPASEFL